MLSVGVLDVQTRRGFTLNSSLALTLSLSSMSSEVVNDENQGVLPVHKQVPSESAADIFALDQPTGRPSILRQSQAENLNKNIPKGVKV